MTSIAAIRMPQALDAERGTVQGAAVGAGAGALAAVPVGMLAGRPEKSMGVGAAAFGLGGAIGGAATGAFGAWGGIGATILAPVAAGAAILGKFGVSDISLLMAMMAGTAVGAGSLIGSTAAGFVVD